MAKQPGTVNSQIRQVNGSTPEAEQQEVAMRPSETTVPEAFERLRQRANDGDERAREVVKKYLDANPELWSRFGNMARHAESALIGVASGGEWLVSEAVKREADLMRRELAGPSPTPLEKMAIERIILCWLQLQHAELRFLDSQQNLGWAKYWLRRQEQADKLYRAALGSLMLIRDLLPPAAPSSAVAIVDASAQAKEPEVDDAIEPPLPAEVLMVSALGANRIANLLASPGDTQRSAMNGHANGKPKVNGHHHRLDDLLAHRS